jgi:dolichol-phosphate mannosyltransferase
MQRALAQHPDFVCQMDADGSHDVDDLPRLVAAAQECDLAIGSRYVAGGALVNWPWHRVALSRTANVYMRTMLRMGVHDCTAGLRCWSPALLARLSLDTLTSNGYAFQVETLYRALTLGSRVREVPITFTERQRGSSKMTTQVMLEALMLPWRLRTQVRQPDPAGVSEFSAAPSRTQRHKY